MDRDALTIARMCDTSDVLIVSQRSLWVLRVVFVAPQTTREHFMKTASQELTLSSALSDPLIRTLMTADNVDPVKLESMLRRIAEELKPSLSTEGRDHQQRKTQGESNC
jgi:hypothetical protein